jgi:hypothetical protein
VGTSGLVVLPRHTRSAAWLSAIGSASTIVGPDEWPTVLMLYCSRTVAACSHVLHALTALPARMSCRLMMVLMPDILEICVRVLGTCKYSYTSRSARLFFMFKGHRMRVAQEPSHVGRQDPEL